MDERQRPHSHKVRSKSDDTLLLKREVGGNLYNVLRTIRELDRIVNASHRGAHQEGQAGASLAPSIEIDRVLIERDRPREDRSHQEVVARPPEKDELSEDEAEEGDLHRFNLLLRQALRELNSPTRKPQNP